MPVTLHNKSKRIKTFNLDRRVVGVGLKQTRIEQHALTRTEKGNVGMVARPHVVPPVLTLLAGETRADLPDTVLNAPSIAAALANPASGLRLIKQSSPPPKAAQATKAPSKKTSRRRTRR